MIPYRFGLDIPPVQRWVTARWDTFGGADRDRFVKRVLLQPDIHVLPLLLGDPDELVPVRQRHLDRLIQVFGEQRLSAWLRAEVDPILDRCSGANGGSHG